MGFEALKGRIKRPRVTVKVNLDYSAAEEVDRLRAEWSAAVEEEQRLGLGLADQSPELARLLTEARAKWRDSATEFTFEALPGAAFDEMMRQYPPTEADLADYRERLKAFPLASAPDCDAEAMAPVLVARALRAVDGEEVEWTDEDGAQLWAELHDGARADIVEAAWSVQKTRSELPTFGIGTGTTPSFDPESIMQSLGEFPSPSSKGES